MKDILGYNGKRVVVTGASSGMGEATAHGLVDLGAEVYALSGREPKVPVKKFIRMDLKDKASIDAAVKQIDGNIDALFNCAGIPGGPSFTNLDVTMVNFVGHRHLTETFLPRMKSGGAIASVASLGGMAWQKHLHNVNALLATPGFDEARAWLEANSEANNGYAFSKQCIIAYVKTRAVELAKKNIRINCLNPCPTDTPMMKQFHAYAGKEKIEAIFLAPCGRYATPVEMAEPLIFLNSNMACFISGHCLNVDFGWWTNVELGRLPAAVIGG